MNRIDTLIKIQCFILIGLIIAFIPSYTFGQAQKSSTLQSNDLFTQYEAALLRSDGNVTVLSSLTFMTKDSSPTLKEFHFEIPMPGAHITSVYHGYPHIIYCIKDGDCNHISESYSDTASAPSATISTSYEGLVPKADNSGYTVTLNHPIMPGGLGSFIINYQIPKVLKGRNRSFAFQAIKTDYQPLESGMSFIPDTDVRLSSPINPAYAPIPLKLQKEFSDLTGQASNQSPVALYDSGMAKINSETNEDQRFLDLHALETTLREAAQSSQYAQKGLSASVHYSTGKPSLWERFVAFIKKKIQIKKEATQEKKDTITQNTQRISSLYISEVPQALYYYRIIYGLYPQSLATIKRTDILPLVSSDQQAYLTSAGYVTYNNTYQDRLQELKIEDPLTYKVLNNGKDFRLCLKNPIVSMPECYSEADQPDLGSFISPNTTDKKTNDFNDKMRGVHSRDTLRQVSIDMIKVHLAKYFTKHQKYPDLLAALGTEFPQFMRPEILTNPSTKQPHDYKALNNGQDFELCLKGEMLESGDESLTPICYHKNQ